MPIQLSSFLVPKTGGQFFLMEDIYLRGGLRVVATNADRDAIVTSGRKALMLVITQDDKKIWQLADDLVTWTEFKTGGGGGDGGARQTVPHSVKDIPPLSYADFDLPLGNTIIVHRLEVDQPCQVQVHETPERIDSNPYKFIATEDHLVDDGTATMEDGSVVYNRRYSILANLETEPSGNIFFRLINTGDQPLTVTLTITFKPVEA